MHQCHCGKTYDVVSLLFPDRACLGQLTNALLSNWIRTRGMCCRETLFIYGVKQLGLVCYCNPFLFLPSPSSFRSHWEALHHARLTCGRQDTVQVDPPYHAAPTQHTGRTTQQLLHSHDMWVKPDVYCMTLFRILIPQLCCILKIYVRL